MTTQNKPRIVILHCSDTPDYHSSDKKLFDTFGLADIDLWHKERGWDGCGYHFVIRRTGELELGRPETVIGAHCKRHNTNSLGVCLVGTRIFTRQQILALINLFKNLHRRWKIAPDNWIGHYEANPGKICPGTSMEILRMLFKCILSKEIK